MSIVPHDMGPPLPKKSRKGIGGGQKPVNTIADKKLRYAFACECASYTNEILQWYVSVFRDPNETFEHREKAADWIVCRAFGKPNYSVSMGADATSKIEYLVRWLPPDPNDTSKYIEAEPD